MTDGGTEIRKLSFQADASSLVRATGVAGRELNKVNLTVGMTAKEMRKAEGAIARAMTQMEKAAGAAGNLKAQQKLLNQELTKSNATTRAQTQKIVSLNTKLSEQKAIVSAQSAVIKELTKRNLQLADSYAMIGSKAAAANKATLGTGAGSTGNNKGVFGLAAERNALETKQLQQSRQGELRELREAIQNRYRVQAQTEKAEKKKMGQKQPFDSIQENGQLMFSNALRYQLYDVAATLGIIGAAATVAGTAIFRTGIEWDKNFANVIRTSQVTGVAVGWLKDQFLDLQSSIPITSEDLATIATLGAQMGVAASNLANFTETTGKFSAASGINVDESATALSRLDQLLPDVAGNYERLASTILLTGVNAVATEQQIVRGTSQIAGLARIANLTTPEVVALSSAMSSLGFSPELQRSVITSSFSRILTATSQVTEKTEAFGKVLNMTGQQFQSAWRTDAVGTYERLLKAIASRGDAVTVLQGLGLASQRLTPNLLKLGQNTDVLDRALSDTARGWDQNTELSRQYGIIANTVAAKIQVLSQSWEALLVTLDTSQTIVGPFIDVLTGAVHILRDLAKNPAASTLATIGGVMVTLTGLTALGVAGMAALAAGFIAVTNAGAGMTAVLAEYDAAMAVGTGAAVSNTGATIANTGAKLANAEASGAQAVATGVSTGALNANTLASNGASIGMLRFSSKVISGIPMLLKGAGIITGVAVAIAGLGIVLTTMPDWMHDFDKAINGIDTAPKTIQFDSKKIRKSLQDLQDVKETLKIIGKEGAQPGNGVGRGMYPRSAQAKKDVLDVKVRTLNKDLVDQVEALETTEEKYAAVNDIAKTLGVTQEDLLTNILPDLGKALGDNAAEMAVAQDATQRLQSAQELWADSLSTMPEDLKKFQSGLTAGANSFLDFGQALTDAFDENADNGEGFGSFQKAMADGLSGFETFYGDIGKLVDRGGIQLATLLAEQGPKATQALADSLKLSDKQLSQMEEQLSLAAFYKSPEFADIFAQNRAILADVFRKTGGDPTAMAAFNKALASSFRNGVQALDPVLLSSLATKFGISLDVEMIPNFDPDTFNDFEALAGARITPIKVPVVTEVGGIPEQLDRWVVEMEGHRIILPVDPKTDEGVRLIQDWRDNEYATPVSLRAYADTTAASAALYAFRNAWDNTIIDVKVRTHLGSGVLRPGQIGISGGATGALVNNDRLIRKNYPGFASGTILRGAGSGTSDSIIARVSNGEAITQARAVRYWGPEFMEDINRMRLPRFAQGNMVGPGSSGQGPSINVKVVQNYPTTRDPVKKLKVDTENLVAGIWRAENSG